VIKLYSILRHWVRDTL